MVQKTKSDLLYNFLLFGIVIILIEITFFNGGILFSAFLAAVFIYYGKKRYHKTLGKIALFIGGMIALTTILNMVSFKFLLVAVFLFLLYRFFQSKKHPAIYTTTALQEEQNYAPEQIHKKPILFKNTIVGGQSTPNKVYEWNDINIQSGVGEFIVDLSNTVLPKGESVICIRNLVGSVQIFIPFELEIEVIHAVAFGNVTIFHNEEQRLFNQNVHYHTANYDQAEQKVKIVTSVIIGNLEVKRV